MKKIEIGPGTTINEAAMQACDEAKRLGDDVSFDFNGDEQIAHPKSHWQDVADLWWVKRAFRQMRDEITAALNCGR